HSLDQSNPQRFAPAEDSGFHRAQTHLKDLGYFFVTEILQIPQNNCRAEIWVQRCERLLYQSVGLMVRCKIERRPAWIGENVLIGSGPLNVGTQPNYLLAVPREPPSTVMAFVYRNPI